MPKLSKALQTVVFFALLAVVMLFNIQNSTEITHKSLEVKRSGGEPKGPSQYPAEWAMLQRTFPFGRADKRAHIEAMQSAQTLRKQARKSRVMNEWQLVGPTNIGGRISSLAFDPQNPDVVYAGAATGGVFKSTDAGITWFPIFDDQAVLPIGDVIVDPKDSDIIYAGTGEANGGHNNFPGGGVFKSTNGGASWSYIGLAETTSIARLQIDQQKPERVYVAAIGAYFAPDEHRGVYRSEDGGETWEKILFLSDSAGVVDLAMNPDNPEILFAAGWNRIRPAVAPTQFTGPLTGIYRSSDGGDSWDRLDESNGLPASSEQVGRIGLTICRDFPDNIYALYTTGFTYFGLYRSTDGGENWTLSDPNRRIRQGAGGFSWYFGQVRVHPADPEDIFALDVLLMRSNDGGVSWPGLDGNSTPSIHVDHHALAWHPENPNIILAGNDGGIYRSSDGGATWPKVQNLPVTQFYHVGIDPENPERRFGGTQDNGTIRTQDGGTDNWKSIFGGDGFYVIVDPNDPNTIYAEFQFGNAVKTDDNAQSWISITDSAQISEPRNWSTPLIMDPKDSRKLYYGTYRVYKTWNGASSWTAISPILTDFGQNRPGVGTITTIAPSASDTTVVYAGTDDSHVWVTLNGGETWEDISEDLPFRWVTRLRVDPDDAAIAYVTFSGLKWQSPQPHIFRTADFGQTWRDISGNLPDAPINSVEIDPLNTDVIFVATDVGVYVSENAGGGWQPLGTGIPMVSVYDFVLDNKNRELVAGTFGRSMYKVSIDAISSAPSNDDFTSVASFELLQNYPNPFNAQTKIVFEIERREKVTLTVFDALGRKVATLLNGEVRAGRHEVVWNAETAASGVYVYRLQAGDLKQHRRMALLK